MYKILVFVAFLFYWLNSEAQGLPGQTLKNCPSGYFDGQDDYCYHIGTEAMSQSEAKKYCKSKYGNLAPAQIAFHYIVKSQLGQNARLNGDTKWWISMSCYELEIVNMKKNYEVFDLNNMEMNCSIKRKPICEMARF